MTAPTETEPTPDKNGLVAFRTKNRPHEEVTGTLAEWRQVKATGFLHESSATSDEGAAKAEEKAQAEAVAAQQATPKSGR